MPAPACRRALRAAALLAVATLAAAPAAARAEDGGPDSAVAVASAVAAIPASVPAVASAVPATPAVASADLVAEALFLCDPLPAGGRDVNVSLAIAEGEPDPDTGEADLAAFPRVQLAVALGERLGLTADVGLATEGAVELDAPGASLKLLLRDPEGGRTGVAASLDLFGSTHSVDETEAGVGLGAIRAVGPVALRASASAATGVRSWSPHLHVGASAAVALGARWRALGEVVADVSGGEAAFSAGPTLKVALGEHTALMGGALFALSAGGGAPAFLFQLTRSM